MVDQLKISIRHIQEELKGNHVKLIVVSKNRSTEAIHSIYQLGIKDFGENKVQELKSKYTLLPKDIRWHMIGHLQSNKVKHIANFVSLIHSVDSLNLLREINKRALQNERRIDCLLQIHIAKEKNKFGFLIEELESVLNDKTFQECKNIYIRGLMGMATYTHNDTAIKFEFDTLKSLFDKVKNRYKNLPNLNFTTLSMGMSNDYKIALQAGSNMVRIGSLIFEERKKI